MHRLAARLALVSLLLLGTVSHAQTAAPSNLDRLETAYRETVKRTQAPLMQQYIVELQALLARSTGSDADAVRFEIARIHKLITEGSVLDLSPTLKPGTAPSTPEKVEKKHRSIVFTLDPDEATPAQPKSGSVPLGSASWKFSKLPAGTYELVAMVACPGPLPAAPTITVNYHGLTTTCEIKERNLTKNATSFRPLSVGTFTLKEDVLDETITISASGSNPWLFVKHIHLADTAK
jgi:hypothetical protein